jgi:hypothetical protein
MKKILIVILLLFSLIGNATTYYVSTAGNDGNAGTLVSPWLTWHYAMNELAAGDTLFIRGGTYMASDNTFWDGQYAGVVVIQKEGTSLNPIVVRAYNNEVPILNCVNVTQRLDNNANAGIKLIDCDYWKFYGIIVTRSPGHGLDLFGTSDHESDNNTFERCIFHHNFLSGIRIAYYCSGNLVKDCDSYANYDPPAGGEADGIEISYIPYRAGNLRINTIDRCRMWNNSDDGIDLWDNNGIVIINNCWAWGSGYAHNTSTYICDANGIKLGATTTTDDPLLYRLVTNCLSFYNTLVGFTDNNGKCNMYLYNNTAYSNGNASGSNDDVGIYVGTNAANSSIYRNNISFSNRTYDYYDIWETPDNYIFDHNSYDVTLGSSGPVATSADFVSVDTTGISRPRNADGSFPYTNFLKLKSTSDLRDVGIIVSDNPLDANDHYRYDLLPDLGAYEYGTWFVTKNSPPIKLLDNTYLLITR